MTLSVLEHLASHLVYFALGVQAHVSFGARFLSYLLCYLVRLALVVQVRISPGARLFGYPLREILLRTLWIVGHALLRRHVLHHDLPRLRRLLCLLAYLSLCCVIRRLHGLHGLYGPHRGHRLHGGQRVLPHARQGARLDVALFDPPHNLLRPERGFVCPRCNLLPNLSIGPAHGLVYPTLGFLLPPLLIAYAHAPPPL